MERLGRSWEMGVGCRRAPDAPLPSSAVQEGGAPSAPPPHLRTPPLRSALPESGAAGPAASPLRGQRPVRAGREPRPFPPGLHPARCAELACHSCAHQHMCPPQPLPQACMADAPLQVNPTRFPRLQPRLQDLPLGTGTVVPCGCPVPLQAAGQVFSLLLSQGHTQRSESHTGSGLFLILSPAGSYTPHIPFSCFSKPSPPPKPF